MRRSYWILASALALLAMVGGATYVALSRQRQAYAPAASPGLDVAPRAGASDTPREPRATAARAETPLANPTSITDRATAETRATLPTSTVTPLVLEPPSELTYDDFTHLATGWAPMYFDRAGNFNGYSGGAYLFDAARPNSPLYDIASRTTDGAGRYAVDLRYSRGTGAFGLMLDVQGDPDTFTDLSYVMAGLTTDGAVVITQKEAGASEARVIAETSPASALWNTGGTVHLEIDATSDGLHVRVSGEEVLRVPQLQLHGGAIGLVADSGTQPLRVTFDNLLFLAGEAAGRPACEDIRRLFVPTGAPARVEGNDVLTLQRRLARLAYEVGEINGVYGPQTAAAIDEFQRRNGLERNGVVGPETWCHIISSDAMTARDGVPENVAEQQNQRGAEITPWPELSSPLFVSVRQADETWRVALLLPGRPDLVYVETEGDAYDPELSPDRQRLAFTSERAGTAGIWVLDVASGELRQVTPSNMEAQFPTWTPDSRQLLYTSESPGGKALAARDYVTDLATGQTRMFSDEHMGWADWSASSELVFTRWTGKSYDLFRANADGSDVINLTNTDDFDEDIPSWSPDGAWIAFVGNPRSDPRQGRQVYVMDRAGFGVRQITTLPTPSSNPLWSPDGGTIAFANQPADGVWQPWLVTATGDNPWQLSANSDRIWFMSWP